MIALPLGLAIVLAQVPAGVIDQVVLVVRRDSLEVARETFHLLERRPGVPGSGWLLDANARWAGAVIFAPVLELTPDTEPAALVYDVTAGGKSVHITGQPGPRRFTLRYVAPGSERARELAAAAHVVIVDDSVFSLFLLAAWRAGPSPQSVTAILPRSAARTTLTVTDSGVQSTTLNRDPAMLRHILLLGGPMGPVHVWLNPDGRLMKVELPEQSLRAERLPG